MIVQNPNFFGTVEKFDYVEKSMPTRAFDHERRSVDACGSENPGEIGADIACGDGQTLGIPKSFGGPYVGFIAAKENS